MIYDTQLAFCAVRSHDRFWYLYVFFFVFVLKVEVEIMERMAEAWKSIEARNARHDTSHKVHREKPMFCMDRCEQTIGSGCRRVTCVRNVPFCASN